MSEQQKCAWLVQGYDGLKALFRFRLPLALSEKEVCALLQRLAARDLVPREVVNASLRTSMKGHHSLLRVHREYRGRVILSVGNNPHYVASTHTEAEFADIDDPVVYTEPKRAIPGSERPMRVCPECQHAFQGNGWDGIDAHWKAKHEKVMPYAEAWPMLKAGTYKAK